jgi:ribonucleotide reductase alpha subunit
MKFSQDLQLPEHIRESINKPRTNHELKVYAQTLPQLQYPDTYKLAGKLFIYLNIKSSPKSMLQYAKILDRILHYDVKQFIQDNHVALDALLESTYDANFEYDMMSASACVNYLLRLSPEEEPIETPCQLYLRQAIQFYHDEGMAVVEKCYRELLDKQYVHASPTMFNAGTRKNQMSSCFLLTIGDNLESLLYTGVGDVGMISKAQGGIGLSLSAIRHSSIANTGTSSGVLPFAKIYDAAIACVDQGGKRNGAMTITLIDWHIDFLDFIQCRDNYTQNGIRLKQANICAYLSSEFMRRVREDKEWTFFCPSRAVMTDLDGEEIKLLEKHSYEFDRYYKIFELEADIRQREYDRLELKITDMETIVNSGNVTEDQQLEYHKLVQERTRQRKRLIVHKKVRAVDVYDKLCDMNIKSSMPYIVYRDTVNYKNNMKNIGSVEGLNLCLEITEPSTPDSIASCNLAHINLKRFVKKHFEPDRGYTESYDFRGLGAASRSLVRNLNKVIDFNRYPLDQYDEEGKCLHRNKISRPNLDNRPLGIGVSGLAEVFANLDIYYDSAEAFMMNKMIFACMYYNCLLESNKMAMENEARNAGHKVPVYGHYESFRTGQFEGYVDGQWQTFSGSPLSNGFFQFDMWQQESEYLKSIGSLDEEKYSPADDTPVEPSDWGQWGSWDSLRREVMKHGVYNSMFLAPMPTASSAQMLNNAETTEAHQTLMYSRKLAHGNYTAFSQPFVRDMIKHELWNQKTIDFIMMCNGSIKHLERFIFAHPQHYPTRYFLVKGADYEFTSEFEDIMDHLAQKHRGMYEISQKVCLKMARDRGIYIDQSQSLNIYLPEPSMRQVKAVHDYSERLRLKTGMYYLRANPSSQTDRFTVDIEVQQFYNEHIAESKNKKPKNVVCTDEVCTMCQ